MSERKITAPGPGWRMPGTAKSKNFNDSMPHLLNAMGNSIERSNKMDFGAPGIHTQNGFHQPHESATPGILWVLLTTALPAGSYSEPSNAYGVMLLPDSSISENSLKQSPEEIQVWNYSQGNSASVGDWIMVAPFNGVYVAISSGSGGVTETVHFRTLSFCLNFSIETGQGCACIESVVLRVPCVSSVNVGDIITVWDPDRCWFNLPSDLLLNRVGRATLFETADSADLLCNGDPLEELIGDCMWIVDHLCCGEEDYADA